MKKILSILIILALSTAFVSKKNPTDLKEYGFKGKVKSVTTINYIELEQKNGLWQAEEDKIISRWKMMFNRKGNIVKMKEYYPAVDTVWNEITTEIEFDSGRKSKYTKIDLFGQIIEIGKFSWIDNFNYEITATQQNGIILKSHSRLNKRFRDVSGGYSYMQGDSIVFAETYENKLKPNGEFVSSTFRDDLSEKEYVIDYVNKEKDKKGNLTKIALVYHESKKLKRLSIRKFEYFE